VVAYVRTVKTASGATAVQIVWSSRKGSRQIEHLGSARNEPQLEALKAAADQRLAAGQQSLDLGLEQSAGGRRPAAGDRGLVLAAPVGGVVPRLSCAGF